MTFYHLVNCVALAALPYLAVYRFYNLSEYRAFWKCAYAVSIFFASQLVKMLILASLFPVVDTSHSTSLSTAKLTYDLLRLSVDMVDLVAIHHLVNKLTLKSDLKFIVTGLGWALGELVAFRLMPLWLEARASEFSWVHLMSAIEANVNLVYYISVAAMMWALSRSDFNKALQPPVLGLIVLSTYRPLLLEVLAHSFHLSAWISLAFKGFYSLFLGVVALGLYTALTDA